MTSIQIAADNLGYEYSHYPSDDVSLRIKQGNRTLYVSILNISSQRTICIDVWSGMRTIHEVEDVIVGDIDEFLRDTKNRFIEDL